MKYLFLFCFITSSLLAQNQFPSILYISDKAAIRNEAIPVLKEIVEEMRKDTTTKIIISGYTDNIGNEEFNKDLSARRAQSVASYLTARGISEKRVVWKAEGSKNPVASNGTEKGKEKNRRVEFQLIKRTDLVIPKIETQGVSQKNPLEKNSFEKSPGKPYIIEGVIIDEVTKKPLDAEINLEEKESGKFVAKVITDPSSGSYKLPVRLHDSLLYELAVSAPLHFFDIQTIAPSQLKVKEKKFSFTLPELIIGKKYKFKNINFVGNEAEVLSSSIPALNGLLKTMQKNPDLEIEIGGHTNGVGTINTPESHVKLSEERAKAVAAYLVKKGVKEKRIVTKGFGCSQMLFPSAKNAQELEMNRRVEIKVTMLK
jgi:outer membrane protein OmpA-like peptidoglycan-associated protein